MLVSPDLAERARAALPERPWSAFLPVPETPELPGAPPAVPEVRRPIWIPHPPPAPARRVYIPHPPRRVRKPIWIPHPAPSSRRAFGARHLVAAAVGALALLAGGYELAGRVPPQKASVLAAQTSVGPVPQALTSALRRPAVRPYARPDAGYLMPNGGELLVDPRGRSITEFSYQAACVGRIVFQRVPIRPNGHFRSRLSVAGGRVAIEGSFVGEQVKGTIRVSGSGCNNRLAAFTGRLS